jgi:predicted NBD/HSP70 family sugar kinase
MMNVSTNIDVKAANTVKIYSALRGSGGMTKSELAHEIRLSFASVSNICTELEKVGLISVKENSRSTGGRRAAKVSFCPDYAYTLAVDMHHTRHIYLGLLNLQKELRKSVRFEVSEHDTLEMILSHMKESYQELCNGEELNLLGVSVGVSAVHDPNTGILLQSSNPVFERVQLNRYLEDIFPGKMILVDNDANLAGLSQRKRSEVAGKNLLFMFFTQGIGLGIMLNGILYRGSNGFAGELGHLKVSGVDTLCKCGGTGCLRTIATLESIAQDLGEVEIIQGMESSLSYAALLSDRYVSGEKAVVDRLDFTALKLGEVMADLFDLFNPEEIVLGGNMSQLFSHIIHIIKRQCRTLSNLATEVDVQIRYIDKPTYELVLTGGSEKMFQHWLTTSFPKLPVG